MCLCICYLIRLPLPFLCVRIKFMYDFVMIIITIIINNDDNSNNWLYMCADSETAAERISVPASRIFCSPSTSRSVMAVAFKLVGDGDGTGEAILMRINDARTASSLHRRRWRTLALPRPPSSSTLFNRDDDNADLHSRRPPDRRTSVVRVRLPDDRSSLYSSLQSLTAHAGDRSICWLI